MRRRLWLAMLGCVLLIARGQSDAQTQSNGGAELRLLQGLWRGSWGGGVDDDGVVYQPVIAELYVTGNRAAWKGLSIPDGTGVVSLQGSGNRRNGRFAYDEAQNRNPQPDPIDFTIEIQANRLSLMFASRRGSVAMDRVEFEPSPAANLNVSFETASGIDDEGNLLVTTYHSVRVGGRSGPQVAVPMTFSRSLKQAQIYRIGQNDAEKMTVDAARALVQEELSVVVGRSAGDRNPRSDSGPAKSMAGFQPDSEAGLKTLIRLLRPGTLVFVIPEREFLPRP